MTFRDLLSRRFKGPAADSRARERYEAIIYYDGPRTKWHRAQRNWQFEEHPGGLRVVLDGMPEPHEGDILQRRTFRFEFSARVFVLARLKGFDTTKIVGEVRPL